MSNELDGQTSPGGQAGQAKVREENERAEKARELARELLEDETKR